MRDTPHPSCILCGCKGERVYTDLQDCLFNAHGSWNINRCPNRECGLMWLNPMPWKDDINIAYRTYYTHEQPLNTQTQIRQNLSGYRKNILKLFLRLTPIYRERENFNRMYLEKIKPGRLLGVGCGSGARLAYLASMGWSVEGQEVDPISAEAAKKHGMIVHLGELGGCPRTPSFKTGFLSENSPK